MKLIDRDNFDSDAKNMRAKERQKSVCILISCKRISTFLYRLGISITS